MNPLSNVEGVNSDVTPGAAEEPVPHPLATRLAAELAPRTGARVLILGAGNGRNVPPLLHAGARVDILEEEPARAIAAMTRFAAQPRVRVTRGRYAGPYPFAGSFDAALSTHALLHGTPAAIGAALTAVRNRLVPGAPLFATFGSQRDPRYGRGTAVAPGTFAADSGDEAGVPHAYFDEPALRALLAGFSVRELGESAASAGSWAHAVETAALVHWFALLERERP